MSPRTIRLLVAFQGTAYEGWQRQKNPQTIQGVFERTLFKIFKKKIDLIGSSRTDSGVHAKGFVAHFRTESPMPDAELRSALNSNLPKDILVLEAKTVDSKFHARYDAKSKVYEYVLWNSPLRPLFEQPFVLWVPQRLHVAAMQKAAKHLKGRHDFSAFKDKGGEVQSSVRTLHQLRIRKAKEKISITMEGDGFLTHMIRVMVGTLLEVGRKRIPPSQLKSILLSKDRAKAGPTVKAQGLTLVKVHYGASGR